MTHLLRGKQAGINNDLSVGLTPELFGIDDLARYGVNSQVSALAYDPVQSLLAVGTRSSQFGHGQIYVFGRGRVSVALPMPSGGATVNTLQFCADKLVGLSSRYEISVWSLDSKKLLASHAPPGAVTCMCTDPTLDYALLGMQTGDVLAYDLDRENLAPFKIPNLWAEVEPMARIATVVSLQIHPRDVGSLLIGYTHGAAIYSFKLAKASKFYQYEVPPGAPGGDGDPSQIKLPRRPKLTQAVWHPTGTFIMTGHEDSSMVFWDVNRDGRMLVARTRTDTDVATPGANAVMEGSATGTFAMKEPMFHMAWCANGQDPDDTGILIAGGASSQAPTKGLCFLELGRTPVYATSSWDVLARHLNEPRRSRILPTPPGAEVVDFCLIPKTSPHFGGAHDPVAILALLSSGELLTLSFPSGMPISPTNQLHPSLTLVNPFIKSINASQMGRERWLGMTEKRQQGPPILKGGLEGAPSYKRFENRTIVHTVHNDGTIRLWDVGDADEVENAKVIQVDVGRAVGHLDHVDVTKTSLASGYGELAVGLGSGELVVFRWGLNKNAGREPPPGRGNAPRQLTNVVERIDPSLKEGLVPFTLLDQQDGPVTAVKMSEVGFVAVGFEGGSVAVIDLRGPAIIHTATVQDLHQTEKRGSFRKRGNSNAGKPEWATCVEFSIMTLEHEEWSSILLHIGTNIGNLATLKIIPDATGRYSCEPAGAVSLSDKITHVFPLDAETGRSALATQPSLAALRSGTRTHGALVTVTPTTIHLSRPPTSKGAHKSFDSHFCDAAGLISHPTAPGSQALLTLSGDGQARIYTLPALRELTTIPVPHIPTRRLADSTVLPSGQILAFTGPSELTLLSATGTGAPLPADTARLFNSDALIPPRPTISNLQWVTGTQYITPSDLDILIGGPQRPPSKRMIAQAAAEEQQARGVSARGGGGGRAGGEGQGEGYWAYMQRQMQERTERLGLVGDQMDNLEQSSQNWVEDVNKFVGRQKRNAAGSILKAKFGF